ncbi:MAG: hypothetical protein ABI882_03070 [Acidobacteriota bacterium]
MNEEVIKSIVENVLRRVGTGTAGRQPEPERVAVDYYAPWTGEVFAPSGARAEPSHPSQEQFNIGEAAEAAAVVSEMVDFLQMEKCTIEKDKACDHCGICRARGF